MDYIGSFLLGLFIGALVPAAYMIEIKAKLVALEQKLQSKL